MNGFLILSVFLHSQRFWLNLPLVYLISSNLLRVSQSEISRYFFSSNFIKVLGTGWRLGEESSPSSVPIPNEELFMDSPDFVKSHNGRSFAELLKLCFFLPLEFCQNLQHFESLLILAVSMHQHVGNWKLYLLKRVILQLLMEWIVKKTHQGNFNFYLCIINLI